MQGEHVAQYPQNTWSLRLSIFLLCLTGVARGTSADAVHISLQLRWDHQFQFAGYYAADWMGYYEEENLDVELRSAVVGNTILSATREVSEGRANFGIGSADILLALDRGDPLVIISSIFQQSAAAYFALESTQFTSLRDFQYLKVARTKDDLIDIEFQAALLSEGIDPGLIDWKPHESGIDHLVSGRVDVVPGYSISLPYSLEQAGHRSRAITPGHYGINFYGDSLFTSARYLRLNRPTVDAFIRASERGWIYAMEHPEEIADRIAAELPRTAYMKDARSFNRFQATGVRKLMDYPLIEPGHINPYRWQMMFDLLLRLGLVKNVKAVDDFVYQPAAYDARILKRQIVIASSIAATVLFFGIVSLLWIILLRRKVALRTEEMRQATSRLEGTQRHARIGSWTWNVPNDIFLWSDEACRLFGFKKVAPMGPMNSMLPESVHPEDQRRATEHFAALAQNGTSPPLKHRLIMPDGAIRTVWIEVAGSRVEEGKTIELTGFVQDITDRERDEKLRQESEALMRAIADNYPHSFVSIIENNLTIGFISGQEFKRLNLDPQQFVGLTLEQVFADQHSVVREHYLKTFAGEEQEFELFINTQYQLYRTVPLYSHDGSIQRILVVMENITDRKRAEKEKEKQIAEKEILLREVHHRVKNNITNIEGLLIFQADSADNPEVKAILDNTISRVQSTRVLYDKLLLSNDYHTISMKDYMESLIDSMVLVFDSRKKITINKQIADFPLAAKKAVSVGIIINELLTNMFKHAFKDRDGGTVSISIEKTDDKVTLIIHDNGSGIDEKVETATSSGFGLSLINMMVEQLNGTCTIVNEHGTKSVVQF